MARPEIPIVGSGPTAQFAEQLRALRKDANVTYRVMAQASALPVAVLAQAARGVSVVNWAVVEKFVRACGVHADEDIAMWRQRWTKAEQEARDHLLDRPGNAHGAEFRILGPVQILAGTEIVDVGSPTVRGILAHLLLAESRWIQAETLLRPVVGDDRWLSHDSRYKYLSQLRRSLRAAGAGELHAANGGYRLDVDRGRLDWFRFLDNARRGGELHAAGHLQAASAAFHAAMDEWRGAPLEGARGLDNARARLQEQRIAVAEQCLNVDLDLGHYDEVSVEASRMLDEHPLRERLAALLMVAHYRSGRTAQALETYQRTRELLSRELGLQPGPQLERFQVAILRGDQSLLRGPTVTEPAWAEAASDLPQPRSAGNRLPSVRPVPMQLPAPSRVFVGRERELTQIGRFADAGVAVTALFGMAGAGKTAVAVHWAKAVGKKFPDGQLYAHLSGMGPTPPLTPGTVLGQFLGAMGFSPHDLPGEVEERAALYRTVMSDRRMLVVLDDAHSTEQIEPLLPGAGDSQVIVTSRSRLASLMVRHDAGFQEVAPLSLDEGAELLRQRMSRAGMPPADEPTIKKVVRLCGGLPLALNLVAATLAARPALTLDDLQAQLAEPATRLKALDVGDTSLARTLALSWRDLPADTARLLQQLAAAGVADIEVEAAATLTGTDPVAVGRHLDALTHLSLLAQVRPGCYRLHDLVRDFALHRAGAASTGPVVAGVPTGGPA